MHQRFVFLLLIAVFIGGCVGGDHGVSNTYTLHMQQPVGEGTVAPTPGEYTYKQEKVVPVTADPASDWRFSHWTGEVFEPESAETTVALTEDRQLRAYFVKDNEDAVVQFEDSALEKAIRSALDSWGEPLQVRDVAALDWLNAEGLGISSLGGIEHLTGLHGLRLGPDDHGSPDQKDWTFNSIADLSPLKTLQNLEFLLVGSNEITDVAPLAHVRKLTTLCLEGNSVTSVTPIADLTQLEQLFLGRNELECISPLAGMTQLRRLQFNENKVDNIDALADLQQLTELMFYGNRVWDISPLVDNPGLGAGTEVGMWDNYLDLSEGSKTRQHIQTLEDRGVELEYGRQYSPIPQTFSLDITVAGDGRVEPHVGLHIYEYPLFVALQAEPDSGWDFHRWEGPVKDPSASKTQIRVNAPQEVTAVFVRTADHTVHIVVDGPGSVKEETEDTENGPLLHLTAEAVPGAVFSHWDGDLTGRDPEQSLTADEHRFVQAFFRTEPEDVSMAIYGRDWQEMVFRLEGFIDVTGHAYTAAMIGSDSLITIGFDQSQARFYRRCLDEHNLRGELTLTDMGFCSETFGYGEDKAFHSRLRVEDLVYQQDGLAYVKPEWMDFLSHPSHEFDLILTGTYDGQPFTLTTGFLGAVDPDFNRDVLYRPVKGYVRDGEGNPLVGATVTLWRHTPGGPSYLPLTTDEDGRYGASRGGRNEVVMAGEEYITLVAEKEGYVTMEAVDLSVGVDPAVVEGRMENTYPFFGVDFTLQEIR